MDAYGNLGRWIDAHHKEQIEFLREHYEHPYKRGARPSADAEVEGGNPGCGDIVRIYLEVEPDGTTIKDVHFTGEGCTVCRTHQEPALAKLGEVRVEKVDAIADRELADRFHVYTLPTTVVMSAEGHALHVNYGYAPANKLNRQLNEARNVLTMERTATA